MDDMIRYRLFLGLKWINDGVEGNVTDLAFTAFLRRVVDTRYPAYTVYDAVGSWEGVPENSKVLEILIPLHEDHAVTITAIALAFKRDFFQDCVLIETQPVNTLFV